MKSKFSILFAWKMYARNLKTTLFIVIIFSLILVLPTLSKAVVEGFSVKIKKEVSDFIGDFIIKSKNSEKINFNKLDSLYFVEFYIPVRNEKVVISDKKGNLVSTQLLIVDNFDQFIEINNLREKIIMGELNEGKFGIILGRETTIHNKIKVFPDPLEVNPGDYVTLSYLNGSKLKIKVNGIYSKEIPGMDIYILANNKFFNKEPNSVYIYLKEEYKEKREEIFTKLKNLFPHNEVRSVKEEMATIDSFLGSFNIISNITFFLGVIISVVIVYSLVFINVKNKRTEIGILRALGIKEKYILFSYLLLVFFYLFSSFFISILVIMIFSLYFKFKPIISPFGEIIPIVDYPFFVKNFIIMSIVLLIISIFPVRSVLKEKLVDQIRS